MAVEVELRERADVHAELELGRDVGAQRIIEAVNALDDEHLVLRDARTHALLLALAGDERIARQLHLAPGEQIDELLVEQRHVDGLQALEVGLAVLSQRHAAAVDVIVVQRDGQRPLAAHAQLDAQPVGERRLAAGGRTGHEHHARAMGDDALGDLRDGAVLQRLIDADERARLPAGDDVVEVGGRLALQDARALRSLGIGAHELRALHERRGRTGEVVIRQHQHHARVVKAQREAGDFAGGFRHVAVEVFAEAVAGVDVEVVKRPVAQQADGVLLSLLGKVALCLLARPARPGDRQVLLRNLVHALLDGAHPGGGEACPLHRHVDAPADAVLKAHGGARQHIAQGQQQNQPSAALIDSAVLFISAVHNGLLSPKMGESHRMHRSGREFTPSARIWVCRSDHTTLKQSQAVRQQPVR